MPPNPVFFIDRNLGAEYLPNELRQAGFRLVIHDEHFNGRQDVGDPEVIAECGKHRWVLMTGDSDLPRRWIGEIRKARIGVFCQTNNHQGPRLWVPRIIASHKKIVKVMKRWEVPFVGFLTAEPKPALKKAKFI